MSRGSAPDFCGHPCRLCDLLVGSPPLPQAAAAVLAAGAVAAATLAGGNPSHRRASSTDAVDASGLRDYAHRLAPSLLPLATALAPPQSPLRVFLSCPPPSCAPVRPERGWVSLTLAYPSSRRELRRPFRMLTPRAIPLSPSSGRAPWRPCGHLVNGAPASFTVSISCCLRGRHSKGESYRTLWAGTATLVADDCCGSSYCNLPAGSAPSVEAAGAIACAAARS